MSSKTHIFFVSFSFSRKTTVLDILLIFSEKWVGFRNVLLAYLPMCSTAHDSSMPLVLFGDTKKYTWGTPKQFGRVGVSGHEKAVCACPL